MKLIVDTKFQLKLTILISWTKFSQKGYFRSKREKFHLCVCPWPLLSARAPTDNSILMSLFLLAAETKRYWTSLPRSFSAWFLQKNVSPVYSINSQNFLVWLHFLLEILRNMCIVIVYFPVYGITSSLSPTWPKRSEQKFKYLENEKSFQDETKIIFHHFPKAFIDANKTNILESGKVCFCKGYEGIIHKLRFLVL